MNAVDLDDAVRDEILRRDILPLYFPDQAGTATPVFVLVAGQPGAGRARAAAALMREHESHLAVVSGDELRAFHPGFLAARAGGDADAEAGMARVVAGWVSGCIRYARESGRSVVLEGTFGNAAAAAGTAARFAEAGFATRVVVVGSRRAESLLSVTSHQLRDAQSGRRPRLVTRAEHDAGLDATRALVASLDESAWVDRVTVSGRDGLTVFDTDESAGGSGFDNAGAALRAVQSGRMGRFDATQWLSELHHVTDYAASREVSREVTELLVDLHETSLREVIPQLQVPAGGKFATAMEQATVARLVALRRTLPAPPRVDVAGPVVAPPGPEGGGVSR